MPVVQRNVHGPYVAVDGRAAGRSLGRLRCIQAADSQINDIERAETEVREIITNGLAELFGSQRSGPISFRVSQRPDLGDDP